ncbi:MAG: HEPN domain-containing protein [Acidobacteria bacterium]|nr:HEPN domain-containing protein [Acidobacteriota bacterium]
MEYSPTRDGQQASGRFRQAEKDLLHARHALEDADYEWACFAAQQAAEKAVKALYQKLGAEARGHSVAMLLSALPPDSGADRVLVDKGKELDKHYIPPRYPNAYPSGAPLDFYTRDEVERAIQHAGEIIGFCRNRIFP